MSHQKLPIVPIFKNTLEKQQIHQRMYMHRKKLDDMNNYRKTKYNETQQSYMHLHNQNPKKNYFIQTKITEIERQNRLLFEKISKINKNKKGKQSREGSLERMKSLNITMRRKQIEDIQRQNVILFSKIQRSKPSIDFKKTQQQYLKQRKLSCQNSVFEKNKLLEWY